MRIVALYKYYWPDTTPYARILKGILENWVRDGHEAVVFTAQPGYNDIRHPEQPRRENLDGVDVFRLRTIREVKKNPVIRFLSFLSFLSQAVIRVCRGPETDFIIVNPHPPILMGLTVRLIKFLRGIPYVYHCEDIHPESAKTAKKLKDGWVYKMLICVDTANCRGASLIVTLSEDMVGTLLRRGINPDKISVINNFILGSDEECPVESSVLKKTFGDREKVFVLLFAGNIGLYQGLDHLIHTARLLTEFPDIKFLFMGEGAAKSRLQDLAGELVGQTVFFFPYQPLSVAKQAMAESNLAIVSLEPGVFRVAYPSKTMNCLAAGSPVCAIVEAESQLAREISGNKLGYCCDQGDHEATARAILDARSQRNDWRRARFRISGWAEDHFGKESILKLWSEIPARVVARRGRA